MNSKFATRGKNVAIEISKAETTVVKGDIIIPHHAVENSKMNNATVISVGPKCILGIKKGDKVLYDLHAIQMYTEDIGILAEDNIILIEK